MKEMRKRVAALVMALALGLTGGALGEAAPAGVSGAFTGTAKGMNGEVAVTVTLTDGEITDVTAVGEAETEGIGTVALAELPAAMIAGNTLAVDTVSGATITSNAVIEGAQQALLEAGLAPEDYMAKAEAAKGEDMLRTCDIVVIGAGGAGMSAAITAADAGRSVILVESQAMVGGNSVRATGGMNATPTAYQQENEFGESAGVEKTLKAAADTYAGNETVTALAAAVAEQWKAYQDKPEGYFDSVELMQLDAMIGGKGINNPALVKTLAEGSAAGVEWLQSIGANLTSVSSFGGASVKRIHRPLDENGKVVSVGSYVVPVLQKNVESRGIEVLYNTTADSIRLDEATGAPCGVNATGKNGETVIVNAKAVILATGGFGANLERVAELKPELKGFMTTNAAGAQGLGVDMAVAVGAATVDMEQIQIHPTVEYNTAALITEGLRGDGAILINAEGKRFTDEVGTRDVVSAAEIAQTGGYSWLVVDQAMADASTVIQGYVKKGFTVTGATYAELAGAMGVDAEAFSAAMDEWNACVEAKTDAAFGRTSFANPLNNAPYYAVKVTAGIHHTMGGLKIDEAARVIGENGEAIPGLFAAGEVTGGVHGANRLGGNAVTDFVVFGRIAGQSAAEYAR